MELNISNPEIPGIHRQGIVWDRFLSEHPLLQYDLQGGAKTFYILEAMLLKVLLVMDFNNET